MKKIFFVFCILAISCKNNDENPVYFSDTDIPINKTDILSGINNTDTIKSYKDNEIDEFIIFNPYKNKGKLTLKGSVHNHTNNSSHADGVASGDPAEKAIKFRDIGGFDFYTYTDHNYVTKDPCIPGIIWIGKSVEYAKATSPQHLCIYNLPADYEYIDVGDDINELIQYFHNLGAFVSFAHPDLDFIPQSDQKILSTNNIDFVEVFNTLGGGSQRAFNFLLSKGVLFGLGVDDHHTGNFNVNYIFAFADMKKRKVYGKHYCQVVFMRAVEHEWI
jgi:hypothetical protein